jgi:hypothetical protein
LANHQKDEFYEKNQKERPKFVNTITLGFPANPEMAQKKIPEVA